MVSKEEHISDVRSDSLDICAETPYVDLIKADITNEENPIHFSTSDAEGSVGD